MRVYKQVDVSQYTGSFDIQYSPVSTTCCLDIYLPEGKGPFPVIVSIHGGAFKKCDKRDEGMILDMLNGLDRGYAVVGVNYRLSGEAQFPEPVKDIKQAIRFIKENADQYHLNKDKIVVWGGSAGGYFTLMAGLIDQVELFDDSYSSDINAKVQGCISQFPPVNFNEMDTHLRNLGLLKMYPDHDADDSPESLFLGCPIRTNQTRVQEANPETYIHSDMCPMLIQHGDVDKIVPYLGSKHFYDVAKGISNNRLVYDIIKEADHGGPKFSTQENLERIFMFIDQCLK